MNIIKEFYEFIEEIKQEEYERGFNDGEGSSIFPSECCEEDDEPCCQQCGECNNCE